MTGRAPEPVLRVDPPEVADERTALVARLDFLQATVVNKAAGLTDEQGRCAAVRRSALTTAGIVKHLSGVERFWFSINFAAAPEVPWPWDESDPHGNFPFADDETLGDLVAEYQHECERSREVVATADLDQMARGEGLTFDLRYALVHMIEETARHCGHLDLLRERIDGRTGE